MRTEYTKVEKMQKMLRKRRNEIKNAQTKFNDERSHIRTQCSVNARLQKQQLDAINRIERVLKQLPPGVKRSGDDIEATPHDQAESSSKRRRTLRNMGAVVLGDGTIDLTSVHDD